MAAAIGSELAGAPRALDTRAKSDGWLARQGAFTFGLNGLSLVANFVTGIIVARALGAAGRGELAAILAITNVVIWIFAAGCSQAAAYHQSRFPGRGAQLLGTWLLIMIPLGALATVAAELILRPLLSAQTEAAVHLARLFVLTIVLGLLFELAYGLLLGDHDFLFCNLVRFSQPALIGIGYVVLLLAGRLDVAAALAATALANLAVLVAVVTRVVRRHGIRRPDTALGRETFWWAIRAHGANIGGALNTRLDLFMIPAFLGASSVGLYSVATNVSWIVVTVAGSLAGLVLPAAARQGAVGTRTVVTSVQVTLVIGVVLSVLIALVAEIVVRGVYGAEFAKSVLPLQLLLPGAVLYAAAGVFASGLYASNRPFLPSIGQGLGMAITAAGLAIFLRNGGIVAAALVSTASYATVFVVNAAIYFRVQRLSWDVLLPSSAERAAYLRTLRNLPGRSA